MQLRAWTNNKGWHGSNWKRRRNCLSCLNLKLEFQSKRRDRHAFTLFLSTLRLPTFEFADAPDTALSHLKCSWLWCASVAHTDTCRTLCSLRPCFHFWPCCSRVYSKHSPAKHIALTTPRIACASFVRVFICHAKHHEARRQTEFNIINSQHGPSLLTSN